MKYKIQFLKNVMKFKLNIQRNIILYVDFIIFIKMQRINGINK